MRSPLFGPALIGEPAWGPETPSRLISSTFLRFLSILKGFPKAWVRIGAASNSRNGAGIRLRYSSNQTDEGEEGGSGCTW